MVLLRSAYAGLLVLGLVACGGSDDGDPAAAGGGGNAGGSAGQGGVGGQGGAGGSAGAPGPWSCLGKVSAPNFVSGEATGTLTIHSFPDDKALSGVDVRVCRVTDTDCSNPFDTGLTDNSGTVMLRVPTDGPIYYEVTGTSVMPSLFFRRGLPPPGPVFETRIEALTPTTFSLFQTLTQTTADPTRGHIVATGRDCDAELASGVSFEVSSADATTVPAYLQGGVPSKTATFTDAGGRAGFVNVPEGPATVSGKRAAEQEFIGTREIYVKSGWISLVGVVPSPP